MDTQTLPAVKELVGSRGTHRELGSMGGVDLEEQEGAPAGGDTCVHIADSRCGVAESNTTL